MISNLKYFRAINLTTALSALSDDQYKNRLLAGGTDLLINLRKKTETEKIRLIDISQLNEIKQIKEDKTSVRIGAGISHSQLIRSDIVFNYFPALHAAVNTIGSVQIRNRGTLGGNICNASPCADSAPALLAHGAHVEIRSRRNTRLIPLAEFLVHPYQTVLRQDEMVTSFHLKKITGNSGSAFIKLGRRNAMSIARMNVAVVLQVDERNKMDEVRIAVGSVMPTAARVTSAEKILVGETPSEKLFRVVGQQVAEEMIRVSGRRWSTEYKEPVIPVLVRRALMQAWAELKHGDVR